MGEAGRAVIAIATSIVGLSLVAVVLSQRANTASVIGAASQGFASILSAATAPVTGNSSISGAASLGSYLGNLSNTGAYGYSGVI